MREIKFKAWNKEDKKFRKHFGFTDMCLNETISFLQKDNVLMQYTGLKDKNEKEIYEGDIIKYLYSCLPLSDEFGKALPHIVHQDVVEYTDGEFNWALTQSAKNRGAVKKIEVIGNIYENPELIHDKNNKRGKIK